MAELTKEQLIEEVKLKIAIAKCHPNSGMAQVEGELFKIALASLEAEPVAWECGENIILFNPDTVEAYAKRAEISPKPLYAASPAPGNQVSELTMWVKRLAHSLKYANSLSSLPDKAMEYLNQNGLISVEDILR